MIFLAGGAGGLRFNPGHSYPRGIFRCAQAFSTEGVTDVNLEEVETKQALVERCQRVVVVADARKWGQVATATFAPLEQVDAIITDVDAPTEMVEEVRQLDIEVIQV